ncbi:MAG: hypothetical protein J1E07_10610, partial [Treponema sp.]|nr:hypothetical protein [Treponema sp.]
GQPMNFACKHTFSYPRILHVKSHKIPLFPGTKIRECHVSKDSDDYAKVVGDVIMSKHDSALWGIKNLSDTTWTFPVDGQLKTVGNNSVVPIAQGMEINFGNTTGTVEK